MTIEKVFDNSKLTVFVSGKLNTVTSPALDAELSDLSGVTELVLDLKDLEQITSAGLRVLLAAQCIMAEQGKMTIANANEDVCEVFELTGFVNFLTLV